MQIHQKTEINMQRELKFRAWDKLAERFIKCDEGYQGHYVLSLKGEFHNLQNGSGGNEYVVQQYTGVKDKNGVDIYEGDILSFRKKIFEVKYGSVWNGEDDYIGFFTQEFGHDLINFGSCGSDEFTQGQVIGNIFENKDLLDF